MRAYSGPRTDTKPYLALRKLAKLSKLQGSIGLHQWMNAVQWAGTVAAFDREVIASLMRCGLVHHACAAYVVTKKGYDFLGGAVTGVKTEIGQVAGPRYVADERPLSASNMARAVLARPGSFDYATIPSRMGNQRVPHGLAMPGVTGASTSE